MGNSASSPAVSDNPSKGLKFSGGRGRSSRSSTSSTAPGLAPSFVSVHSETLLKLQEHEYEFTHNTVEEEDDESTVVEESDEEEEEDLDWEERLRILEDSRGLKKMAVFFLHPEKEVESDAFACGRNFFERPSAPLRLSKEESDEKALILEEALQMKEKAVAFMHPELPVETSDPTACGRNYFERFSAYEETKEYSDEREAVLADAKMLKSLAIDYQHPEVPVRSAAAVTKCVFDHGDDPSFEDVEERVKILEDVKALKQAAVQYLHPELPVTVSDPVACARCYFDRYSAPEQESAALNGERSAILADAMALKSHAADFFHPERPVVAGAFATARCYFDRASAPQSSTEDEEERATILQDCSQLKDLAARYMHPEVPITSSGNRARCYFDRASAPVRENYEDERTLALQDAAMLKKLAVDYLHPERPVGPADPALFGRCYFHRPSALNTISTEESNERDLILQDAEKLKVFAADFLHPELPVSPGNTGSRCFFDRASAPVQLSVEEVNERERVLRDAESLKSTAIQYLHPEAPIAPVDPALKARCYFDRFSGPVVESTEDGDERTAVLAEASSLKSLAVDYLHPEHPVISAHAELQARCYFHRPSAPAETEEEAEEVSRIMADTASLKKLAVDYMHPELPVKCNDPSATGRNYFDRPSNRLHDQMIHSFPPHDDDEHSDHHEHADHFGLDEDFGFLNEVRDKLTGADVSQNKTTNESDDQSNLSRSPSSVMLFQEDPIYE